MTWRKVMEDMAAVACRVLQGQETVREKYREDSCGVFLIIAVCYVRIEKQPVTIQLNALHSTESIKDFSVANLRFRVEKAYLHKRSMDQAAKVGWL